MRAHHFNGRLGAAVVVGIALAVVVVIVKRHTRPDPLGIKSDRLESVVPESSNCSAVAWPYGCDFFEPPERKRLKPDPKVQRRPRTSTLSFCLRKGCRVIVG